MSQYFDLGEQTLWNPSNGAARLFLRQVSVFEAELGWPSGLGEMREDECQIDPAALKAFVEALLEQHLRTSHAVMIALSEGFVATMLVLAERAGIELAWPVGDPATWDTNKDVQVPGPASDTASAGARPDRLRAESHELSRFMVR
ncbi:hypothetical protein DN069_31705 [Streptacidiphilus pinicola]|uniref:Uncharacterized protein n=1 Tax=Streptacidiphilus pinicola TaxID=2219663 RepID=A0A2X0IVI7_9ACTN|nr:DUF6086 family protein [Streptacidiphilus pinicola]RAG81656.1 hypothetical protein DN069_31705 [Streptacidiphilus pinicola]